MHIVYLIIDVIFTIIGKIISYDINNVFYILFNIFK
jgi:hypothetical protein